MAGASRALAVTLERVRVEFPPAAGRRSGAGVVAVDDVSLTVSPGEFVAFLGPSGCGKSTLLRAIAGLQPVTSGRVSVQHRRHPRRDVAFVFQDPHLLPWRNVLQNVALPLELLGVSRSERLEAAKEVLGAVGLSDALFRYPAELSGGMRMRCSLARALVTQPKLLLLDEPFAALDEITRQRLDEMLRELWLGGDMTVVFVTHSIQEATFLADRAVVFSRRPARILIDHAIDLPKVRPGELRTDIAFARHTRTLYRALQQAEGQDTGQAASAARHGMGPGGRSGEGGVA